MEPQRRKDRKEVFCVSSGSSRLRGNNADEARLIIPVEVTRSKSELQLSALICVICGYSKGGWAALHLESCILYLGGWARSGFARSYTVIVYPR